MLCLSGFELYSGWVPLKASDSPREMTMIILRAEVSLLDGF